MPDFLDSLITRARDGERGLAPRTPGLFEPTPAEYGPGGAPLPSRALELSDAMEGPVEERVVPAQSDPPRPSRGAVPPPTRRAASRQSDRESATPPAASLGDDAPASGRNRTRETGRAEPESRDVSRRLAPATREPRPVPGAAAPAMPTPPAPSSDTAARASWRTRGRSAIPPVRPSLSPPVDDEARTLPERPGAGESRPASDRRAPEASGDPLTRLGAELGALRRAEPLAADSGRTPGATVVIKTVDPSARSPMAPNSAPASASPRYIHVSIGQVEVRAAAQAAAPPRPRQGAGSAPAGLDEYLRRRNGGTA
jgi:hypothetical protein